MVTPDRTPAGNEVYALASFQGDIYAGGKFTGGTADTARYIAHFNDTMQGTLDIHSYYGEVFSVSVFPNPSSGTFTINSGEKIKSIKVNNLLGEEIYKINASEKQIDLSLFSSGLYFLTIITAKGSVVKKILKE